MEFKCPHCQQIITEKDLQENQISATHLKEFFLKKENQYKQEFAKNLLIEKENEYKIKFDALKEKLEQEKEKNIAQKELELHNKKQVEIDQLKNQLKEQDIKIKSNAIEIEKFISQKELEITNKKQEEIDQLKNQLKEQDIKIKNTEANIKTLLSEKELELHNKKQIEIDEIKRILQEQEIQLKSYQSDTKAMILEKELTMQNVKEATIETLRTTHVEEKKQMQEKIRELELANALNRVIQSKAKGENFEHDVEKVLRESFEPEDIIKKITSGEKKADYLKIVRNEEAKEVGRIVYEVKNAEWKDTWEKKLIDDMAKENSKYGILIATSLNKKYPGISFKRSDLNPNIYLVDTESFVFIGQLIKSLIKAEYKIEERFQGKNREEKIQEFKTWKETQLPAINKIIQDNISRIEKAENSILKQVDEIRIGRQTLTTQWLYKIKEFIENIMI